MNKISKLHWLLLLVLSVVAFKTSQAASLKDGLLKIYFLNIGQGDAIFIEAPNGNQVLIDGGPDDKVLSELSQVMPFYDHTIDAIIVSHPHADHIGGLVGVLKHYQVEKAIEAQENYDSAIFRQWRQTIKEEKVEDIEALAGKILDLGNGVTITLLYPFRSVAGTTTKKPHDDVVVAMLRYGEFKLLLTGDMEVPVEEELIAQGIDLDADILKVGHHGSRTSTSEDLLNAVTPQVAFIEVGAKNRYGHPNNEVLMRLDKDGIKYYRTDIDGRSEVVSDGKTYRIK